MSISVRKFATMFVTQDNALVQNQSPFFKNSHKKYLIIIARNPQWISVINYSRSALKQNIGVNEHCYK